MSARAGIVCPACSAPAQTDWERQGPPKDADQRFAGTQRVSLWNMYHPREVKRARRLFPDHQSCIRDDGTVAFDSRSQERSYRARRTALEDRINRGEKLPA